MTNTDYKFRLGLRVADEQARQAKSLYDRLVEAVGVVDSDTAFPEKPELRKVLVEMEFLGVGCGLQVKELGEGMSEVVISSDGVEDPYPYPTLAFLQLLANEFDMDPSEPIKFSWSAETTEADGSIVYQGGGALIGAGRDEVTCLNIDGWLVSEAEDFKNVGYGM